MNWRVEFAPEVERDVAEAAQWYEVRQPGLGGRFIEEIIRAWGRSGREPVARLPTPSHQEHLLAIPGTIFLPRDL